MRGLCFCCLMILNAVSLPPDVAARGYAERLVTAAGNDWTKLVASLTNFDEAFAAQTAFLVQDAGTTMMETVGAYCTLAKLES